MSVPSDRALPTPAISDAGSAYLDGLRALGANLVIVAHVLALYFGIKRYPFGSLGVTIFFLLSGFLIMQSMLSRAARPGVHVPAFMADRTARILTPYVPALVVIALANLAFIDGRKGDEAMDMKALFDGFDPSQYEEEAKRRWGHTEAYEESMRRTQRFSEEDWKRLRDEQSALYAEAAALLRAGTPPDSTEAMDVAERFRLSIDRWFYPCSHEMHRNLAALYESDPRFAENMDKHGRGLTAFLTQAIRANAARHGA